MSRDVRITKSNRWIIGTSSFRHSIGWRMRLWRKNQRKKLLNMDNFWITVLHAKKKHFYIINIILWKDPHIENMRCVYKQLMFLCEKIYSWLDWVPFFSSVGSATVVGVDGVRDKQSPQTQPRSIFLLWRKLLQLDAVWKQSGHCSSTN